MSIVRCAKYSSSQHSSRYTYFTICYCIERVFMREMSCILNCCNGVRQGVIFFGWKNFIHIQKKLNKKDNESNIKHNKTNENYVQRKTIYNSHIGNQQINSSGTAYLLIR